MAIYVKGYSGPEVVEIQELLNQNLNPSPGFRGTSYFGNDTYRAVKRFQRENWLVVDGQVGPCTLNALRGTETYNVSYPVNLIPQPDNTTCWAASSSMILRQNISRVISRNRRYRSSDGGLLNDSELSTPRTMRQFARTNGLHLMLGQSWSAGGFSSLMVSSGPLMLNILWNTSGYTTIDVANSSPNDTRYVGSGGHLVVCSGIRGNGTSDGTTIRIHDPWPPNRGKVRSFSYGRWMRNHLTGTYQILHQ